MRVEPLDAAGGHARAEALGDSPWTATAVHLLRRGLGTAYVAGDLSSPAAAIIFWHVRTDVPMAFGADTDAAWRLLQAVQGWRAVNVAETQAPVLAAKMERDLGRPVRFCAELYHILTAPPNAYTHPLVRRLTIRDIGLIEEAPPFLKQGRLFGGPRRLLREGIVVGAVDPGRLVATAHTSAMLEGYADIGVATLEPYRRQGIAAAAASLTCQEVQATGRTPVWTCGEDNTASLRLGKKIGFESIGRRIDLVPFVGHAADLPHSSDRP